MLGSPCGNRSLLERLLVEVILVVTITHTLIIDYTKPQYKLYRAAVGMSLAGITPTYSYSSIEEGKSMGH